MYIHVHQQVDKYFKNEGEFMFTNHYFSDNLTNTRDYDLSRYKYKVSDMRRDNLIIFYKELKRDFEFLIKYINGDETIDIKNTFMYISDFNFKPIIEVILLHNLSHRDDCRCMGISDVWDIKLTKTKSKYSKLLKTVIKDLERRKIDVESII